MDRKFFLPPTGRMPRGQAGFTLIELLVCLTILALMTAFLSASFTGYRHRDIRHAADDLANTLRATRERAISSGHVEQFSLAPAGEDGAPARVQPKGIEISFLPQLGDTVSSDAILFFPDGSTTGGSIALAADGKHLQIRVDWLTGRVSVAEDARGSP